MRNVLHLVVSLFSTTQSTAHRKRERCIISIAHFISRPHSITLSEILGLSLMCSDGRGYHGNGAVLWSWLYAHTHTYSSSLPRSLSISSCIHIQSYRCPQKYHPSWFWLTRSRGGRSQLVMRLISHNALQPLGTHCACSQPHQYSWAIWWICKCKKAAVSRWTTAAHQSEATVCARRPGVGDVAGNGVSGHQRQLVTIVIVIDAQNSRHAQEEFS